MRRQVGTAQVVEFGSVGELAGIRRHEHRGDDLAPGGVGQAEHGDVPDGWVHTGDLGMLDDRGYLQVTGRIKDMIIRGGENIYATEIEQVLFGHPGIRDVAVLGLPDPTWGEICAAVLTPAGPGQLPAVTELHDLCRASLAPHKTPARWFGATELPLTGSGKIQKFRLREQIDGGELSELLPR